MENNTKKAKKIQLSRKNIFDLSKKLAMELSKPQLIQLMGTIACQLAGSTNNHVENTETFAESLELDTSLSELQEIPNSSPSFSNLYRKTDDSKSKSCRSNVNSMRQLNSTTKEIINRQCGKHHSLINENEMLQMHSDFFMPRIFNEINENVATFVETPLTDFIDSSSQNFNNTVSKDCQSDSLFYNKNIFYPSVNNDKCTKNDNFGLNLTSNLGDIPIIFNPQSHNLEIEPRAIYNSETEESITLPQCDSFSDLLPIHCITWRPASPYCRHISGIYRSCKSTDITRRLNPIRWPSKSRTRKKYKIDKLKETNNLVNIEFVSQVQCNSINNSKKLENNIHQISHGSDNVVKGKELSKLVNDRIRKGWVCTYSGCRHLNSTKHATCDICFNPRWNYYCRFARDFLCSGCGYVNYKTRVCCKKCKFKFPKKLERINLKPFIKSSIGTPIRI